MSHPLVNFRPSGPVAAAFYNDRSEMHFINGPIGSGKTRTCLTKLFQLAREQRRSPLDGVRYSKWIVVRDTYRRMAVTVLQTWFKIISPKVGKLRDGGNNGPSFHHIRFEAADGSVVDMQVLFAAIGDQNVEDFCRGFEVTGALVNEADLMTPELWIWLPTRCGRYPDMAHGGPSWKGVMGDLNAPIVDTWAYDQFYGDEPVYPFYRQPGGLEPDAENLQNLPAGYYTKMVAQLLLEPDGEMNIRRLVHNLPGYSRDGKPVFPEFNDALHVPAEPLEPIRGLPVRMGFDAGLHPAAIWSQHLPDGQRRILFELYRSGYGPVRFAEEVNNLIHQELGGMPIERGYVDPSAEYGADKEGGERNWLEIVSRETGITLLPAPTNELVPRLEAVREPLRRMIDGHRPGLLLSRRCKMLRGGFNSLYRYKKLNQSGGRSYALQPEKNESSHCMDALQYEELGEGGYLELMHRQQSRASGGVVIAKHGLQNYGRRTRR